MTEAAPDHTDSKHSLDDLFQLLIHVRGVLPDTKAKGKILSALQRGDLQGDFHIRGGARRVRPREVSLEELHVLEALNAALQRASGQEMREPSPEQLRVLEEALQGREASEENIREAMDRATAVLYEHAPPQGLTGRVHRESWEPGRVFSLTVKDGRLNILPVCALDYPWSDYSFTIANWWMVDKLWPPRPPQQPSSEPNPQASSESTTRPPRPGSADFWIDELFPNKAWRPLKPTRIHRVIEQEINKRNAELVQKAQAHNQRATLLEHVSLSAVRDALRRRLER